ncbi:MAG: hypothetical protein ACFFAY_07475 [Promethearchaeota archaeon]
MVDLIFGDLTTLDILLALATGFIATVVVVIAFFMSEGGTPKWKPRKLVHTTLGTVIALTIMSYSNLSGPAFAAGIFLTVLMYAWAHKPDLISELLLAGSREGDQRISTFAAGFMGLISFALVFILFNPRPEILVAAILTVSWADGAGEVFGRPYGGKFVKRRFKNKSIEGTLAVFIFGMLSVGVALFVYSVDTSPIEVLPQIFLIATAIALVEVFSIAWTDNFFLPFITAVLMWQLLFPSMILIGVFP